MAQRQPKGAFSPAAGFLLKFSAIAGAHLISLLPPGVQLPIHTTYNSHLHIFNQ
jgi:hypothetical protein